MKECKCCKNIKDESEFYSHPKALDGLDSSCKDCRKEKVRLNREKKAEYYREYDKKRFKEDPRVSMRHKRYQSTEAGKQSLRKSRIAYKEHNPIKRAAHTILGNAVRDGRVEKVYKCESCSKTGVRIHGHHDDYAFPLCVRWLCSSCHKKWHHENGEALNG